MPWLAAPVRQPPRPQGLSAFRESAVTSSFCSANMSARPHDTYGHRATDAPLHAPALRCETTFPPVLPSVQAMSIAIGNAPCSWGVEFPDAPSNPPWQQVFDEASQAGYSGIELGPVGYVPEDPSLLADNLAERGLVLTAGVVLSLIHI